MIDVVGVGGAGVNIINNMVKNNLDNVNFIVVDTHEEAVTNDTSVEKILLDKNILNEGDGNIKINNITEIVSKHFNNANVVFIITGLGGKTGSELTPFIVECAKKSNAFVVAGVTIPFVFEGPSRKKKSLTSIENIRKFADKVFVLSNDELLQKVSPNVTMHEAFSKQNAVFIDMVNFVSKLANVDEIKDRINNFSHELLSDAYQ